jgi:hypothetical protein
MKRLFFLVVALIRVAASQVSTVSVNETVTLTFSAVQSSTAAPLSQTLGVTMNVQTPILPVVASLSDSTYPPQTGVLTPSWLVPLPASIPDGKGSATFPITVHPAGLAPGTYGVKVAFEGSIPTSFGGGMAIILLVVQPTAGLLPNISGLTNAAIPALDIPSGTLNVSTRTLATIFGTHLADGIGVSSSPGTTVLGGTEVHLTC